VYLRRRALTSAVAVLGLVVTVFLMVRVLPGDVAAVQAGPEATQDDIAQVRARYGLSDPLPQQFLHYTQGLLKGDLGTSVATDRSVRSDIGTRLPASLELALVALFLGGLVGIAIGAASAMFRSRRTQGAFRVVTVFGAAMPLFWLGLLLTYFLYFRAGVAPAPVGRLSIGVAEPPRHTGMFLVDSAIAGDWATFTDAFRQILLPAITLAVAVSAPIAKMTNASIRQVMATDHFRAARILGVNGVGLWWRDCGRNAMLPVLTTTGILVGYLIGGNILVENVYSWPGLGQYALSSVQVSDLPAIQGFVLVVGLFSITVNLLVDGLYILLDPRLRLGQRGG
jgi:ABC-type dipeptide/oligopeptide/nickel transport system permease component